MKIKSMTAVFGKLEKSRLELSPGFNLVYAPNEGGKSTWAAFWKSMLYGIDTKDRDKKGYLADKNRYLPWSGAPMEGEMDLEWQGRDITLRRGQKGSTPFGAFSALYTGTGEKVPGLDAASCGPLLTGAGREVFERSAFIGSGGNLTVTAAPELERRIAAIVSSGEEDVSFSQTEGRLKDWLNRRRVNRSVGLIPKLEGELQRTRETLDRLEAVTADIARLESERAALEHHRAELAAEKEIHLRLARRDLNRRCAQAGAELEEAQQNLAALEKEFSAYGPLPDKEQLKQAQGELQYLRVLDAEIKQGEATLAEAEATREAAQQAIDDPRFLDMTGEEAGEAAEEMRREYQYSVAGAERARKGRWSALAVFVVLAVALGIGRTMFPGLIPSYFFWLLLPFYAVIAALGLYDPHYRRKEMEKLLARWKVSSPEELTSLAEDYRGRYDQAEETARRTEELRVILTDRKARRENSQTDLLNFVHTFAPQATNLIGCSAALSRALNFEHELALARNRVEERRRRREDLLAQGGQDFVTLELLHAPERTPQETDRALASTAGHLDQINEALNQARGRQKAMGDPAALAAQAEKLEGELTRRQEEYDALVLALDTLRQANARLQERFSPELNRLAGEYMARLTGGQYAAVSLNRALEGEAARTGDVLPHSALYLSRGTADQLYLAVRLAVCRLCLPEKPPLVLDDALAAFDDQRLRCALDLLLELSREQQVVLFTCQRREGDLLAGIPGVTYVELT